MGKGSKGGKKQEEAPKVEETKKKPDAAEAEAGFMKALQREMGDVEITEASVREYIAKPPVCCHPLCSPLRTRFHGAAPLHGRPWRAARSYISPLVGGQHAPYGLLQGSGGQREGVIV